MSGYCSPEAIQALPDQKQKNDRNQVCASLRDSARRRRMRRRHGEGPYVSTQAENEEAVSILTGGIAPRSEAPSGALRGSDGGTWWADENDQLKGERIGYDKGAIMVTRKELTPSKTQRRRMTKGSSVVRAQYTTAIRSRVADNLIVNLATMSRVVARVSRHYCRQMEGHVAAKARTKSTTAQLGIAGVGLLLGKVPFVGGVLRAIWGMASADMGLKGGGVDLGGLPGRMAAQLATLSGKGGDPLLKRFQDHVNPLVDKLVRIVAVGYAVGGKGARKEVKAAGKNQKKQSDMLDVLSPALLGMVDEGALEARLRGSTDFRIMLAGMVSPMFRGGSYGDGTKEYSRELNNFIVTGAFGQLTWEATGDKVHGSIPDIAPDGTMRTWSIKHDGGLATHKGTRRVNRGLSKTLPYWGHPVKGPKGQKLRPSRIR